MYSNVIRISYALPPRSKLALFRTSDVGSYDIVTLPEFISTGVDVLITEIKSSPSAPDLKSPNSILPTVKVSKYSPLWPKSPLNSILVTLIVVKLILSI